MADDQNTGSNKDHFRPLILVASAVLLLIGTVYAFNLLQSGKTGCLELPLNIKVLCSAESGGNDRPKKPDVPPVKRVTSSYLHGTWQARLQSTDGGIVNARITYYRDGSYDGYQTTRSFAGAVQERFAGTWAIAPIDERKFRLTLTPTNDRQEVGTFEILGPDQVREVNAGYTAERVAR